MPIPKLRFLNPAAGTPKKPVPLRYAVLVTGIDVGTLFSLLSGELHYYGADSAPPRPLLGAYELGPQSSAKSVTIHAIRDIQANLPTDATLKTQLKRIPRSFFVWSDNLAEAFQHFIELVPGRENANEWHLDLNWNPALGNHRPLIEECPDPANQGSARSRQAADVEKRDRQILSEYKKLKSQFPHLSKSGIATRIAMSKKYENASGRIRRNLTAETIRRRLNHFL